MDPAADTKRGKERADTDASLRAERSKTDVEFAKTHALLDHDADHIVEVARELAEETLRVARQRADGDLETADTSSNHRMEVEVARVEEDGAVAEEQAIADKRIHDEREERQRALFALILEREATDDGLLVERARADEAVAARDDLLGVVSHDLRTMLSGIALTAGMLARHGAAQGENGKVTTKHASNIERAVARMNRLVGDLLDVVSLETGKLRVTPRRLDANEVAREAVEAFQPSFSVKAVTLTAEVAADPLIAKFDHGRILQVLANLLTNALKFSDRGGSFVLAVRRNGTDIRFSVTDTGVGNPADHAAGIVEVFRKASSDHRPSQGLGFYIAKCIVKAHAGSISAEVGNTGGAMIHFTLPGAAAESE